MPDAPIVDTTITSAPKDYTFSGSGAFLVKSVRASIDGSGGAGSYDAALQLLAPDGTVMFSAKCETDVAAGASADVSWFPGGGLGGNGAGTGAAWFFGRRSSNFGIAAGGTGRVPWTTAEISDTSVFSMSTNTNPNDTVNVLKPGICIAQASATWTSPQNYGHAIQIATGLFSANGIGQSPVSDSATDQTELPRARSVADMFIGVTQSVPQDIELLAINGAGVGKNVVLALMVICYLPNATLVV